MVTLWWILGIGMVPVVLVGIATMLREGRRGSAYGGNHAGSHPGSGEGHAAQGAAWMSKHMGTGN